MSYVRIMSITRKWVAVDENACSLATNRLKSVITDEKLRKSFITVRPGEKFRGVRVFENRKLCLEAIRKTKMDFVPMRVRDYQKILRVSDVIES